MSFLSVTQPSSFHPSQLTGQTLWFDSTDNGTITLASGKVSSWVDKLKSGYTFTDNSDSTRRPTPATVSNTQVFDFDGTSDLLYGDTSIKSFLRNKTGYTLMCVALPDTISATRTMIHFSTNSSSTTPRASLFNLGYAARNEHRTADGDSTSGFWGDNAGVRALIGITSFLCLAVVVNTTDRTCKIYKDGVLIATKTSYGTAGSTTDNACNMVNIGGQGASNYFDGKISQVVIRNMVSTDDEIRQLTEFFGAYISGIYTPCRKQVVLIGDSIINNSGVTNVYERNCYKGWLANSTPSTEVWLNYGVDGSSLSSWNSGLASNLSGLQWYPNAVKVFVIHCGSNDISSLSQDGAQTYARLVTLLATIRAAHPGCEIVISTALARSIADQTTKIGVYNGLIRSNQATLDVWLADCGASEYFDESADMSNVTYIYDLIHPTNTGCGVMGGIIGPAVSSVK